MFSSVTWLIDYLTSHINSYRECALSFLYSLNNKWSLKDVILYLWTFKMDLQNRVSSKIENSSKAVNVTDKPLGFNLEDC